MANANDREKYVGISDIINIYKYIEMFVCWLLSYSFFNVVAVFFFKIPIHFIALALRSQATLAVTYAMSLCHSVTSLSCMH